MYNTHGFPYIYLLLKCTQSPNVMYAHYLVFFQKPNKYGGKKSAMQFQIVLNIL